MLFNPLMHRISVDLPEPDGPMMQITSPFRTSRLMPFNTSRDPKNFRTSRSETIGISGVQSRMEPVSIVLLSDSIFLLELSRPKGDWVNVCKEQAQQEKIERQEELGAPSARLHRRLRVPDGLVDAENGRHR